MHCKAGIRHIEAGVHCGEGAPWVPPNEPEVLQVLSTSTGCSTMARPHRGVTTWLRPTQETRGDQCTMVPGREPWVHCPMAPACCGLLRFGRGAATRGRGAAEHASA